MNTDIIINEYSGNEYVDKLWHKDYNLLTSPKDKCINTILYLLQHGGPMEYDKLMNLIYLTNRYHLRNYARMIWEDVWIAKLEGPRPFYGELVFKEMLDKGMIDYGYRK